MIIAKTEDGVFDDVVDDELKIPLRESNGDLNDTRHQAVNGNSEHYCLQNQQQNHTNGDCVTKPPKNSNNGRISNCNNGSSNRGNVVYASNGGLDSLADHRCRTRQHRCCPADGSCRTDSSYSCGMWSFKPRWLQPFANKKAFLAVFCLTSVLQGMYYTYFVSVLTTIEKLFQIQSKTTGIIMSATEIGQIGGALLLTYYGGQGHRPKWIAGGMLVFALASILCSTPHFLFGGGDSTSSSSSHNVTAYKLRELEARLCRTTPTIENFTSAASTDITLFPNIPVNGTTRLKSPLPSGGSTSRRYKGRMASKCDFPEVTAYEARVTHAVLAIFFVSLLFIGIGATAVYTLGIPYIDDNVATRESPLYFGITIGVRIFGPVFGFLLGSFCTSVYVNFPFDNPGINDDDPQWIGAWWLGVFIVGAALILTSFPMMGFPRKLPTQNKAALMRYEVPPAANGGGLLMCIKHQRHPNIKKTPTKKPSLKDFPAAIKRLLKNEILLCRTASSVLHILPIAGLYTFLPKYLESQFQLTATKANMISGMAGILVMGIGIFASGTFMRKFKPNARFVARWIAVSALTYSIGMMTLMWLGCPMNDLIGLNGNGNPGKAIQACNATCECRLTEFAPICSSEGKTYLSPCVAGCTQVKMDGDNYTYTDCECLGSDVTAVNGFCDLQCNNLTWYIVIFSSFVLIHSTSEVGSMLLTLRCVDPQDKAMALGLISFAIGLFGNVPCPIIYGAVVDSSCLFWEDNCGKPGACRIYDPEKFRMVFHGLTALIMLAAFFVDALVCYKAASVRFHDDEEQQQTQQLQTDTTSDCNRTANFDHSESTI